MDSNIRKTLQNNLQIIKPVIDNIKSFPSDTNEMTPIFKYIKNLPPIQYSLIDDNLQVLKDSKQILEIPEEPKLRNTINHEYIDKNFLTINNNTNLTNLNLYFLYNTDKKRTNNKENKTNASHSVNKKEPSDTIKKRLLRINDKMNNLKSMNFEELNKTQRLNKNYFTLRNTIKEKNHKPLDNIDSLFHKTLNDFSVKDKNNSPKKNEPTDKIDKNNKNKKVDDKIKIKNKKIELNKKTKENNQKFAQVDKKPNLEKTHKEEQKIKNIVEINNKIVEINDKIIEVSDKKATKYIDNKKNSKSTEKINKIIEKSDINNRKLLTSKKEGNNNRIKIINNNKNDNKNIIKNEKEPTGNINLSEFIKIKQIGKGTFGKIFAVKWKENGKKYALKQQTFSEPTFLERRKGIVKIINDFLDKTKSNGVIRIYSSIYQKTKEEYTYYELMEMGDRDWEQEIAIRRKKGLYYSEKEIFNIAKQLISTLSLLQKNHITHRDIKHQNILIVKGNYKLCDFGELRLMKGNGLVVQRIRGSELFMSPILFYGLRANLIQVKHNTYKSDVFSLGMCLLYAATMHFDGTDEIREIIDMKKIRSILEKYLKVRYSNKFISLLCLMLETNEELRPDFEQLENKIDNILIV